MKNIILTTGTLLILANSIIGLLVSNYLPFNWLSVNAVLITNISLLYKLASDNISNGFKISLSFIFPILCLISIILAILSPIHFKDNYFIIGFILILFIEIFLLIISRYLLTINQKL